MQLFSIGIDDKDIYLKDLIQKKSSVPWIEGLYIEENRVGDLIFLSYSISLALPREKVEEKKDRLYYGKQEAELVGLLCYCQQFFLMG